ncbi:MAG: gamma carbonic anhydrase family protein [Planctomycetes bacterium]|nr:gamma carbonic anhydrase family protein [Planctomycetota bacterium]
MARPQLGKVLKHKDWYYADTASIVGDVHLEKDANIWFHTTLRGDDAPIYVGEGTNIQDGCVVHADPFVPVRIGKFNTIGHSAMIHAKEIGNYNLIGIHSTILGGAVIGNYCVIAAGAVVNEGAVIPDGSVVMGLPAKVKREVSEHERMMAEARAKHYIEKAQKWLRGDFPDPFSI